MFQRHTEIDGISTENTDSKSAIFAFDSSSKSITPKSELSVGCEKDIFPGRPPFPPWKIIRRIVCRLCNPGSKMIRIQWICAIMNAEAISTCAREEEERVTIGDMSLFQCSISPPVVRVVFCYSQGISQTRTE